MLMKSIVIPRAGPVCPEKTKSQSSPPSGRSRDWISCQTLPIPPPPPPTLFLYRSAEICANCSLHVCQFVRIITNTNNKASRLLNQPFICRRVFMCEFLVVQSQLLQCGRLENDGRERKRELMNIIYYRLFLFYFVA